MEVVSVLLPYVAAAFVLLALAALRAWSVLDARVDLLFCVILSVVAATVAGPADLGGDLQNYHHYYLGILQQHSILAWWEPGFAVLAWLFAWIGAPFSMFVFVCVLASHMIKLYVFNELSSNRLLAFFIVYCLSIGELGFVRQFLAASLVLLSYLLIGRGKISSALVVIVMAALIHKTALLAGVVVLAVCYGIRSVKPLLLLGLVLLLALLVSPGVRSMLIARIEGQVARYIVSEYVQGVDSSDVALFRNVAKYFAYGAFAAWMLLLPARSVREQIQARAAMIVLCMSLLSVVAVTLISPVFARMGSYIFPFLAVSVRVERFAPYRSQFAGQYGAALLLVLYLVVAMYPLAEYF